MTLLHVHAFVHVHAHTHTTHLQVPFHMHINLELMECVYLTSAMLLEIPYMALTESQGRRRMISKSFHHQLKVHEKMPLLGEW